VGKIRYRSSIRVGSCFDRQRTRSRPRSSAFQDSCLLR